jgi:hypothetical protein
MLGTGQFLSFLVFSKAANGNLEAVMVRDAMPMGDVIS